MPSLPGFTDNAFQTRRDLVQATVALVEPLVSYQSPAGARIKILPSTAAAFDDVAAQLEGFARPLWALACLGNESGSCEPWLRGLVAGVDPESAEYWGDLGDFDQRMVEMESIAFTILVKPEKLLSFLDERGRMNLKAWFMQINSHAMPKNNWRWFRIFVNLALVRILGVPEAEVQDVVNQDFALLDSFYIGQGWSSDGAWDKERQQADYYSGSFAIQFAQLLYVRFAPDDKDRVERYKDQAREFASTYWRYFDVNGAAIPFGRSMTYRWAFAAFWSAIAFAGVELDAPLNHGVVKGLLLRHLRWWSHKQDIFNTNGTLNIGFTYPNMYMSEEYNSPQSVYWCLKSFIVLALSDEDSFWQCDEQPHPLTAHTALMEVIWPPRHIMCNTPEHHFLLSSGQGTRKGHKAREAKYGKFAYSSAFGFSVPAGPLLSQSAPDSTLSASLDGITWGTRSNPFDERLGFSLVEMPGGSERVPALTSVWKPWPKLGIEVTTTLFPLSQYPGWHVRVHKVQFTGRRAAEALEDGIELVDSGFALNTITDSGYHISESQIDDEDAYVCSKHGCLVRSKAGASGVVDLTSTTASGERTGKPQVIRADPNTNLIVQRSFIPSMRHTLGPPLAAGDLEILIVTGVFAVAANHQGQDPRDMWRRSPRVEVAADGVITVKG